MNVLTPDRQKAIEELLATGHSLRKTAAIVGCSKITVQTYKRLLEDAGRLPSVSCSLKQHTATMRESDGSIAACLLPKFLARMGSNPPSLADALKEMKEIPELLEEIAAGSFGEDDCGPAWLVAQYAAAEIIRYSLKKQPNA